MTNYLSQTDAADRLGVSRQRVSALIKAGKLKAKVIAGRPVVSEQELDRFAHAPRSKGGRPPRKR